MLSARWTGVVLTVIGVLCLAGSVLDWSGVSYSSGLDRGLAAVAGGAFLFAALLRRRRHVWVVTLLGSVLALNMAIVNINDIANHRYEFARYPHARVGSGLFVLLTCGIAGLAVSGLSIVSSRRSRRRQEPV